MTERTPPYSEEAERGALGAMLLQPERVIALAMSRMKLPADVFYVPAHRILCQTFYDMMSEGSRAIDVLTVGARLEDQEKLESMGGSTFLDRLIDGTPTAEHAEYYLDIVRQKYILRRQIEVSREVIQESYQAERGDELLKTVPQRYIEIIDDVVPETSNKESLDKLLARFREADGKKKVWGLPTPWKKLNDLTGGLETGLTMVAGNTSQGKSTLEDCISIHIASQGIGVGRVTLEMTRDDVLLRAACRKAGVSLPKLKAGYAGASQLAQMDEAKEVLGDYPFYINDTDREVSAICTWARAEKMRHDIGLLTIDYVQKVTTTGPGRAWSRDRELSYISDKFEALSFELAIPVLVLSQLSRENVKTDRPPKLSDLRDSGSLEQSASKIIFVFKDKKAEETKQRRPIWLDVAKHRNGETGKIEFWLRPHYFRFDQAPEGFKEKVSPQRHEDTKGKKKEQQPEWTL